MAEALLLSGRHPELVVTGIHIGHYGKDLDPTWTLSRLVALLLDRVPDARFRLGSIEATEVDDLLIDLLATSGGRLAPHVHMPLQSGADPVLKLMRRWHTREQYRVRVLELAERVSPLGLGADVATQVPRFQLGAVNSSRTRRAPRGAARNAWHACCTSSGAVACVLHLDRPSA